MDLRVRSEIGSSNCHVYKRLLLDHTALVGPMSSASNLIFKKTTWPCKFKLYSGLEAKFCWKHMTHIKKLKHDQPLNFRAHLHGEVFQPQTSQSFSLQGWTAQILPRNPSAEKNCNIWSRKFFTCHEHVPAVCHHMFCDQTCSSCLTAYVVPCNSLVKVKCCFLLWLSRVVQHCFAVL